MRNDKTKKTSLAKLLATEDISVHTKKVSTASFNIKSRELVLPDWKDMTSDTLDMLIGHEVGHALYTPIELLNEGRERKIPKSFINVIEDVRIERMIQSRYPGLVRLFKNAYVDLVNKDIFEIKDKDISEFGLIDRINISYKTGIDVPFLDSEYWVHDRLSKCLSYEDVLELSKDIADFMEDNPESQGQSVKESPNQDVEMSDEENDEDTTDSEDSSSQDSQDSEDSEDSEESSSQGSNSENSDDWETDYSSESVTDRKLEKNLSEKTDTEGVLDYVNFPDYDIEDVIWSFEECKDVQHEYDLKNQKEENNQRFYDALRKFYLQTKKESSSTINYLVKEFEMKKSASLYSRAATSKHGSLDVNSLHRYKFDDDLFKKITVIPNGKNHGFIMYLDWSGSMYENIEQTMKQVLNLVWFASRINVPFEVYAFSSESKFNTSTSPYERAEGCMSRGEETFKYKEGDVYLENLSLFEIANSKMNKKKLDDSLCFWLGVTLRMVRRWDSDIPCTPWICPKLDMVSTPLIGTLVVHDTVSKKFMSTHNVEILNTIVLTDGLSNPAARYIKGWDDEKKSWIKETASCFTLRYGSYGDSEKVSKITTYKLGKKEFKIDYNDVKDTYSGNSEAMISELIKVHKANTPQSFLGLHLLTTTKKGILTGKSFSEFTHYQEAIGKTYNVSATGWHFWDTPEGKKLVKKTNKEKFLSCGHVFNFDDYYILPGGSALDLDNDMLDGDLVGADKKDLVKAFSKNRDSRTNSRVFLKRFVSKII